MAAAERSPVRRARRRYGVLIVLLLCGGSAGAVAPSPGRAAIASAHPLATAAGREVIDAGGNAFDAAVAVSAALAVVEPYSSGIGGGAFFLLHRAEDSAEIFVDARETAPAEATPDMFLDENGDVVRTRSLNGALAAAIPGLPAALNHLAERYGRLPLARLLEPAAKLAEEGFETGPRYALMAGYRQSTLAASGEAGRVFLASGEAPAPGTRIFQPDLARTLRSIGADGGESFYRGAIAQMLVDGVRAVGGIWRLSDLAAYSVKERKPIVSQYQGIRVVSAPPPSSGGIVLTEALNILSRYDLGALSNVQKTHVVVEAMRRAYRDRADFLGDPDFATIPTERLLSADYAEQLAADLTLERATPSTDLPALGSRTEGQDTTHFSIIDAEGNRVGATLSINTPFGSTVMPPGTGVVLNNEMDDFSARPLSPNTYGLVGTSANLVAAGKRPLSSMTPTFLEAVDRVGVLGTPGGSRIISMVLLGVLEFAEGRSPERWVSVPRFHHQYLPDEVQYEKGGLDEDMVEALSALGHALKELGRNYGNMQGVLWDRELGVVEAASDPRGEGGAEVWQPQGVSAIPSRQR